VQVVGATSQLDIRNDGRPAHCVRLDVVKLKEPALRASTLRPDESATTTISLPDLSPHRRRNVTRARRRWTTGVPTLDCRHLGLLELRDQQCQRPIDNRSEIAVRDRVPQQILCPAELVVRLTGKGELQLESFGRKRHHRRGTQRWWCHHRSHIALNTDFSDGLRGSGGHGRRLHLRKPA
jgi:hypothetical protein